MKRNICLLALALILTSCHENVELPPVVNNHYGVVLRNEAHANIYVQCSDFTIPAMVLTSMEESDTIYSSSDKVEIKWFGEGTYYKIRNHEFQLKKNVISKIILKETE